MSRHVKVMLGFVVLALMSCLSCFVVSASTWYGFAYDGGLLCEEGFVNFFGGGQDGSPMAPYVYLNYEIEWVDDDCLRLRPDLSEIGLEYTASRSITRECDEFNRPIKDESGNIILVEEVQGGDILLLLNTDGWYSLNNYGLAGIWGDQHLCVIDDVSYVGCQLHATTRVYPPDGLAAAELLEFKRAVFDVFEQQHTASEIEPILQGLYPGTVVKYHPFTILPSDTIEGYTVSVDRAGEPVYKRAFKTNAPIEFVSEFNRFSIELMLAPYVLFTDGVSDEVIFEDYKVALDTDGDQLRLHDNTPEFMSAARGTTPVRDGYNFVGWKLTTGPDKDTDSPGGIRQTVETDQMDDHAPFVVYEAVWQEADSAQPKLAITKTANKSTVAPGAEIIYTVTVSNVGEATAVDVTVSDILDGRLVFQSLQLGHDGVVSTSQPVDSVYHIGNIDPGASQTLYITVKVADGTPNGSIINKVTATRRQN